MGNQPQKTQVIRAMGSRDGLPNLLLDSISIVRVSWILSHIIGGVVAGSVGAGPRVLPERARSMRSRAYSSKTVEGS